MDVDNCSGMVFLLDSPVYKGLCIFKLISCICAVTSVSWSWFSLGYKWLVHPNAKLLYTLNMFALFLSSLGYGMSYTFDCYRLFLVDLSDPCNSMIPKKWSFHVLMIIVTFDSAQVWIFLALALERLYASYNLSTYGKVRSPTCTTFFAILLIMAILASLYFMIWYPVQSWDGHIEAFSLFPEGVNELQTVRKFNQKRSFYDQLYIYLHTGIEMFAIIIFHFVYYRNRRGLFGRYRIGLAENYQKTENKNISIALLPIFYLHFIIFLVNFWGLGMLNIFMPLVEDARIVIWGEYFAWTTIYAALMPILMRVLKNRRERERSRRMTMDQQNAFVPVDELFTLHLRPKSGKSTAIKSS